MHKGRIVILSGPSGSGKTTLYKKILKDKTFRGRLIRSVSATTRPKRRGEIHGRDYLFMTRKEFLAKKKRGYFLETQKVFTDYYGTPLASVRKILMDGKNTLLCIEVKGAQVVMRKKQGTVSVFVKPPSVKILKERLKKRATEGRHELARRVNRTQMELAQARYYDYQIINNDLKKCYQQLKNILVKELQLTKMS